MTPGSVFLTVFLFLSLYYYWFIARIIRGLRILGATTRSADEPSVTVIIPARNESHHIGRCLQSIQKQEYPQKLIQIIVVDDASDDGTDEIVRGYQQTDDRIHLITLPSVEGLHIGRKPAALAEAVRRAAGMIILTTDADCIHNTRWVRTMLSYFDEGTALVAGPVVFSPPKTFFDRIECLDFLGIVTSAAGLIGAGRPIICNGANLAYRTQSYRAVQDNVQVSSNDDGTLMNRIVTRGIGSVRFASHQDAVVETESTGSVLAYLKQRRRWAAVRGRFLDQSIYGELAWLFLYFISLLVSIVWLFFEPAYAPAIAVLWVIKAVFDAVAVSLTAKDWHVTWSTADFISAQILHPLAIIVPTIMTALSPFEWKGRRLHR